MNHDDIHHILANEEKITPSPGFLASVMGAVEREAAAPPPLEFPWIRALPGFLATGTALVVATRHVFGSLSDPAVIESLTEQLRQVTTLATGVGFQWIVLAFAVTIISVALSSSLIRGRSYV